MLTIIFYSIIFAFGILAAYVDWEKFIFEATSFTNVENPVGESFLFGRFLKPHVVVDSRCVPRPHNLLLRPYLPTRVFYLQ